MLDRIKKCLGYAWASPMTLLGVIYTSTFRALKWYKWHGIEGDAMVWVTSFKDSPTFLKRMWTGWGGHAIGNVVVMNEISNTNNPRILIHEQKHVDQMMRLGIFQPIIYGLCYVGIKLGCPGSNAYYDNPFEIDARRHAGQIVDVIGVAKRITESKKTP